MARRGSAAITLVDLSDGMDGEDGDPGTISPRTVQVPVYATGASAPTDNSGTYNFNNNTIDNFGGTVVWSLNPPQISATSSDNYYIGTLSATETINGMNPGSRSGSGTATVTGAIQTFLFNGIVTFANTTGSTTLNDALASNTTVIDGDRITTGAIHNATNFPATAGNAPGMGEAGAHISITNGAFTFGNADSFIRFNVTEGLVTSGLGQLTEFITIYRAVASGAAAPVRPPNITVTFASDGSTSFTPPTGWSTTFPSAPNSDYYQCTSFVRRNGPGMANTDWSEPINVQETGGAITWSVGAGQAPTFNYDSFVATSPTRDPMNGQVTVTATPSSGAIETAVYTVSVTSTLTVLQMTASNITVVETTDSTDSFTLVANSTVLGSVSAGARAYSFQVQHDSGEVATVSGSLFVTI